MPSYNQPACIVNNQQLVTLRHVVTDFSYTLMHACTQTFNQGMQLDAYLQLTYSILSSQCMWVQMTDITFRVSVPHT